MRWEVEIEKLEVGVRRGRKQVECGDLGLGISAEREGV